MFVCACVCVCVCDSVVTCLVVGKAPNAISSTDALRWDTPRDMLCGTQLLGECMLRNYVNLEPKPAIHAVHIF